MKRIRASWKSGSAVWLCLSHAIAQPSEIVVEVNADRIESTPSVTTLSYEKEELHKKPEQSLGDFLKFLPGFQVSTNLQGISGASIRGLPAGNIVVFWDGIRLNDPLDPTTSFDFSRLKLSSIEKIEIVRGPEAGVWGSGATGAVIFVSSHTSALKDGLSGEIEASAGSYETYRLTPALAHKTKSSESLFRSYLSQSRGISSASERLGNKERDGRQEQQGFFYNVYRSRYWKIATLLHSAHSKNDADLRGGVGGDEASAKDSETTAAASVRATFAPSGTLENSTTVSYQRDQRYHKNSVEYARYKSDSALLANEVSWRIAPRHLLRTGVEFELEKGRSTETTGFSSGSRESLGIRSLYEANYFPLSLKSGFRVEKDIGSSRNPGWAVFSGVSYMLKATGTNLSLSGGHSFKRASLYQLYSNYGHKNLAPESVWSYDVSALQNIPKIKSHALVTYFSNYLRESIDFDFATMKYFNGGRKRNYGVETVFETDLGNRNKTRLEYTYTRSDTLRVAKHKASTALEVGFLRRWSLTQELRYLGERADIDPTSFSKLRMPAFILYNASLRYDVSSHLAAYIRIDNVFNKRYEEINGFGSPGRHGEIGIRYNF